MNNTIPFQSFEGQFLVAMPGIDDTRFTGAVILICSHTQENGAMGLVINNPHPTMGLFDLFAELHITPQQDCPEQPVYIGGPDKVNSGFILHSEDYKNPISLRVNDDVSMAITQEILYDIALNKGPQHALITFGCCTWIPGQLEEELMTNTWLTLPFQKEILFETPVLERWNQALKLLGIDPCFLATYTGKA